MDPKLSQKIDRYLNGTATEAERNEVETWFEASGEQVSQFYNDEPQPIAEAASRTLALLQQRIADNTRIVPVRRRRVYRYAIAASVLLAVAVTAYLNRRQKQPALPTVAAQQPVLPGKGVAMLKTGGGKVLLLNGANGLLEIPGQAQVSKNGQLLAYNAGTSNAAAILYDTLYVPDTRLIFTPPAINSVTEHSFV